MQSRVTTRNGDAGSTRTLSGEILPKNHPVLMCTGRLDALRAQLAEMRLLIQSSHEEDAIDEFLLWLLHLLFLVGTEVNDPRQAHPEYRQGKIGEGHLRKLEKEQQRLEKQLDLPHAFIVSASCPAAARVDVVTTVARDFERSLVALKEAEPAFEAEIHFAFINRLSDYLYILARYLEKGVHHRLDYTYLLKDAP